MTTPTTKPARQVQVSFHLPMKTVAIVLATLLLVHTLQVISPLFMPLFIALILAVALHPLFQWLEVRRVPRWVSVLLFMLGLTSAMLALFFGFIPLLLNEFSSLLNNLPQMKKDILDHIAATNPLRTVIDRNLTREVLFPSNTNLGRFYDVGSLAFGGLTELVLVLVLTVYLIVDGPQVREWILAFFSPIPQRKIRQTLKQVSEIVFAYAAGQFITSLMSSIFTFAALSYFHVPGASLLAVLAGLFDVLPVLGFFLSVIPAMIFSLRVSTDTSIYILLAYLTYHALENYLIVPLVYGNRLRLSGFTVLMAILSAWLLAGIEGAITVLPLVASYPVIEKIWLKKYVGDEVVEEHESITDKEESKTPLLST